MRQIVRHEFPTTDQEKPRVSRKQVEAAVRPIVNLLASRHFDAVLAACTVSRLNADDLRKVVDRYGRTFMALPQGPYQDLEIIRTTVTELPSWAVSAPLWTKEEGRSDLELSLTVVHNGDEWQVELDDLYVP